VPQRDHGIDAQRPSRWDVAGPERNRGYDEGYRDKGDRIVRADTEKKAADQATGKKRYDQSCGQTEH